MMDGKGRFIYADGAVFDGVMRADEKHGIATYRWAGDGAVGVIQYRGGAPVGEGVRWSADRRTFVRSFVRSILSSFLCSFRWFRSLVCWCDTTSAPSLDRSAAPCLPWCFGALMLWHRLPP